MRYLIMWLGDTIREYKDTTVVTRGQIYVIKRGVWNNDILCDDGQWRIISEENKKVKVLKEIYND